MTASGPVVAPTSREWEIRLSSGPAGPFHRALPADDPAPQVWIRRVPRPALVLGSTQPDDLIDRRRAAADGIEVCRRRSGGGLVHVDPDTDCWIDVIVPRHSSHWHDDVGVAFHWIGDHWARVIAAALSPAGPDAAAPVVHRQGARTPAGSLWCFADVGHGEVTIEGPVPAGGIAPGGAKVLGLSQRRTRTWLRLQCLVLGRWPGPDLDRYLDQGAVATLATTLGVAPDTLTAGAVRAGFPAGVPAPGPDELAARFIEHLPAP